MKQYRDNERIDPLSAAERSHRMSLIPSKNTSIELKVRKIVYSMGYRYRIHQKDLPAKPDLVFKGRKKVIFVNGCFWHQHNCENYRMPQTNNSFWDNKLSKNVERDRRNYQKLIKDGWKVLIIWECQLSDVEIVKYMLKEFLDNE